MENSNYQLERTLSHIESFGDMSNSNEDTFNSIETHRLLSSMISSAINQNVDQDHLLQALQRMALKCPQVDVTQPPTYGDSFINELKNNTDIQNSKLNSSLIDAIERTVQNVKRDISEPGQELLKTYMAANPPAYMGETSRKIMSKQILGAKASLGLASIFDRQSKAELNQVVQTLDI